MLRTGYYIADVKWFRSRKSVRNFSDWEENPIANTSLAYPFHGSCVSSRKHFLFQSRRERTNERKKNGSDENPISIFFFFHSFLCKIMYSSCRNKTARQKEKTTIIAVTSSENCSRFLSLAVFTSITHEFNSSNFAIEIKCNVLNK